MSHPYTHFLKCNRQLTIVGYLIKKKSLKKNKAQLAFVASLSQQFDPSMKETKMSMCQSLGSCGRAHPTPTAQICCTTNAQILTTAIVMTTPHHWSPSTRSPAHANCSHKPLGCDHSAMGTESIFTIRAHAHTLSLSDTHQHTLEQKR